MAGYRLKFTFTSLRNWGMEFTRLFTYMTNQQMHIYKYAQSYINILQEHVSVSIVTIPKGSYNKSIVAETCG
jgi:N6-adenosine-specific RNA methylase IME4